MCCELGSSAIKLGQLRARVIIYSTALIKEYRYLNERSLQRREPMHSYRKLYFHYSLIHYSLRLCRLRTTALYYG